VRDLALTAFMVGALPYAIRHTWIAVLLWTWISIMNPHRLTWGFAYNLPFAAAAAIAAFISILLNRDKLRMPWSPPVVLLAMFVFWICLTTVFAYYPASSLDQLIKVLKIQVMTMIAFAALRERKHIELFVWVNALSISFYGVKGGIFTILSGGGARVWGPGGFIGGNNEIGLAIIMTIPLLNYLRVVATRPWLRLGLLASMMFCAAAALGTQSRGAFLAIIAMALLLWVRSKNKFLPAIGLGLMTVALLAFMPASWEERMRTMLTYEEDGSAMGRITTWITTIRVANNNLLGGGFDIYHPDIFARFSPAPDLVRAAHSIYFQVLGEHGWVGLTLFLLVFILGYTMAGNIRKEAKKRSETEWLQHLAGMCQVSLVGYAVGGAFLSLAYFDLPYNIIVVLVVAQRWMREKQWETESQGAFGAAAPTSQIRTGLKKRVPKWS
jgi:putative inorganic carbon (HCO3(-)) transporter